MTRKNWHNLPLEQVLKDLKTSTKGLTVVEVLARQKKFGKNELPKEKKLTSLQIFLSQFKNPLIYILLLAAAISLTLQKFVDMAVILLTVGVNTIVGFIEENKASRALTNLKKLIEYRVKVIRNGWEHQIKVGELVPGDIVFLKAGDRVPADGRILELKDFQVDEASLTGESLPVDKTSRTLSGDLAVADRENMVFMGTMITRGMARAVVTEIGADTFLGETAYLIRETPEDKTPLQLRLLKLSKWMGGAVGVICFLILILGTFAGKSFFEMFTMAVAIAVSAMPEGLAVAVTVILAIGMQRISKRGSLVRNLLAAETLGSTTVICTDKTGTLTEGKMGVTEIFTGKELLNDYLGGRLKTEGLDWQSIKDSAAHIFALNIGLACNNAIIENPEAVLDDWVISGDPTESALLLAAVEAGLNKRDLEKNNPRLDEIAFDSEKKYMVTLHDGGHHHWLYIKGAPEKVLERAEFLQIDGRKERLTLQSFKILKNNYEKLTSRGLRLLAVGYKELSKDVKIISENDVQEIVLVGFIGLKDPLRKEVPETLRITRMAGIRTIVVTGDHRLTAKAIAEEAGLKVRAENIIDGPELEQMSDAELRKKIKSIYIFARVTPKHKIRIVDALQSQGEVVAMTGDGVNDAPAIKSADIGVAVGSGSDITKETADLVLLDNNFRTIVKAVEQGRAIFDNIKKVVVYLMSDSFTEIILIGGSLLLGLPLPLLPAQILWVNLVADGFPTFALAFESSEKEVMREKPYPKKAPIMDAEMKALIFIIGIFTDLVLFGLFFYFLGKEYTLDHIRTFLFAALSIDSLFYIQACRSFRRPFWGNNLFSNNILNLSILFSLMTLVLSVYWKPLQLLLRTMPLDGLDWTFLLGLGIMELFAIELTKSFFLRRGLYKK
ncbi:MAG: HAD-IC family P-type ATPase [Patescibacteria group bacterium]|nr:HAD-IC family P-type ATPase [Patescibacteria group bacterium]MDD5490699.1 HAD-IC family P-type ATPase [Patescibacteria group bacterium]